MSKIIKISLVRLLVNEQRFDIKSDEYQIIELEQPKREIYSIKSDEVGILDKSDLWDVKPIPTKPVLSYQVFCFSNQIDAAKEVLRQMVAADYLETAEKFELLKSTIEEFEIVLNPIT